MSSPSSSETLVQITRSAPSPTVSFQTLGCRLNQSESGALAGGFDAAGFQVLRESAVSDFSVINTCSVTAQAESKCRALIRRILRKNPQTFIAVTGCYAQIGVEALKQIKGVDLIVGTDHKMSLPVLIKDIIEKSGSQFRLQKRSQPIVINSPQIKREEFTIPNLSVFDHVTRPNVKIQDGCDFFCTFCIIPYTRGRSRSRAFDDVLLEVHLWVARGHKEIVLTGVNLGDYCSEGKALVDLIQSLEAIDGLERIRISSIEPTTVPLSLLHLMKTSQKLCAYLHLPLQSGSDQTLSGMDRRYTGKEYLVFAEEALGLVPNLGLGTDVMVGFPGETEAAFQETVSLLKSLPFSYLHVFPYSRRKGTRVTRTGLPPVHPAVIKQRTTHLIELSKRMRTIFYQQAIGEKVPVLFETRNENGLFTGLTDNYIRVGVETTEDLSGALRHVKIEALEEELAIATLI